MSLTPKELEKSLIPKETFSPEGRGEYILLYLNKKRPALIILTILVFMALPVLSQSPACLLILPLLFLLMVASLATFSTEQYAISSCGIEYYAHRLDLTAKWEHITDAVIREKKGNALLYFRNQGIHPLLGPDQVTLPVPSDPEKLQRFRQLILDNTSENHPLHLVVQRYCRTHAV